MDLSTISYYRSSVPTTTYSYYTSDVATAKAATGLLGAMAGMATAIMFVSLIITVIAIVSEWKIFSKANKPGWAAIIPIYNIIVLFQVAGLTPWLIFALIVPFVNIGLLIYVYYKLAQNFGKGIGFTVGMIFLPIIFLPMLAFGSAQYVGGGASYTPATTDNWNNQPAQDPMMNQPSYDQPVQNYSEPMQPAMDPTPVEQPVMNQPAQPVMNQPAFEQPVQPAAPVQPMQGGYVPTPNNYNFTGATAQYMQNPGAPVAPQAPVQPQIDVNPVNPVDPNGQM